MKQVIIATGILAASLSGALAGTLDTVKQRGTLVCGVSAGFAGFSAPDSQGNYKGLDADYCRAIAAATDASDHAQGKHPDQRKRRYRESADAGPGLDHEPCRFRVHPLLGHAGRIPELREGRQVRAVDSLRIRRAPLGG